MKQIFTLICMFFLLTGISLAQSVPMGMKYQAVARDTKGEIMADQHLRLKINLYDENGRQEILYSESHEVTTSELGLFSLTVGEGAVSKGSFEKVPWSSKEIWMEVSIQSDDATDFVTISNSKMLSVPYAFHAATANELVEPSDGSRGGPGDTYTKYWVTPGNFGTDPSRDKLGTADNVDLALITNNTERMRVTKEGDVVIAKNLSVKRNVFLNSEIPSLDRPDLFEMGKTINYGDFTVENTSQTTLTGDLDVYKNVDIDGNTNVDGLATVTNERQSDNITTGALVVTGGVGIGKNINIGGAFGLEGDALFKGLVRMTNTTESTNSANGTLVVEGGVGIGKNLNVGGATTINNSFSVIKSDTGFIASITNVNGGKGDGLIIKLGKTHPAWIGNGYLQMTSPGTDFVSAGTATVKGWITGVPFKAEDILTFIPDAWIVGTSCELFNKLKGSIMEGLGLPITVRDIAIALNGHDPVLCKLKEMKAAPGGAINWEDSHILYNSWVAPYNTSAFQQKLLSKVDDYDCPGCWDNNTTCEGFDGLINDDNLIYDTKWPVLFPPQLNFLPDLIPGLPENLDPLNLACSLTDFPSFDLPNISLLNVSNSLTNENQFISFKDAESRELGSIRAQSVLDWEENYLNSNLIQIVCGVIGLDFASKLAYATGQVTAVVDSYNSIGVEYASGHGDYAEWLERIDHDEIISKGDIVAVAGGKITKDLSKAEQVMAVSGKPIMLGNSPAPEEEANGNKIAFMGQIPVKIIGPVSSGDFIVGNAFTPGYGIAVKPADLTSAQAHLVVGRSWDTNLNRGPKMINTVIGVDNGSFLKILQDNRSEVMVLDSRVRDLETKLESVMASLTDYTVADSKMSNGKRAKLIP